MGFTSLSDMKFASYDRKPMFNAPKEGQVEAHYQNGNPSHFWFNVGDPAIHLKDGVWYFTPEAEEKYSSLEEELF